jgi:NAD-dependent DNA ligase
METIYFSNTKELNHPFLNKNIVFTGALEKMTRVEAAKLARLVGANIVGHVNAQTNFLIIGNKKKGISSKEHKARLLEAQGADVQILNESDFYWLIELHP